MSDMKSKLPDFKELTSMTSKLFGDIKTSVSQIVQDYKDNRAQSEVAETPVEKVKPAKNAPVESKTEEPPK